MRPGGGAAVGWPTLIMLAGAAVPWVPAGEYAGPDAAGEYAGPDAAGVPAAGETGAAGAAGAAAWLVAVGAAGLQAEGAGAEEPQIEVVEADLPEAEPDLPEAELDAPGADAGGPGVEEGLLGVDAAAPGAEAGGPGAEAGTPRAEPGMPDAEAGFPGAGAGEGQAGFVSAVDGVRGLAGIAVLAFDAVSWLTTAELAKPGLAKPGLAKPAPVSSRARAAAASADVLSGSVARPPGRPDASDVAVPGVTTASGAPAPRGFAGTSGLPLAGPSACGGTAAFGNVTSDRLPSGAFVKDAGASARPVAALSLPWTVAARTLALPVAEPGAADG